MPREAEGADLALGWAAGQRWSWDNLQVRAGSTNPALAGEHQTLAASLPAATFAAPGTQLQMLSSDPCTQQRKEARPG